MRSVSARFVALGAAVGIGSGFATADGEDDGVVGATGAGGWTTPTPFFPVVEALAIGAAMAGDADGAAVAVAVTELTEVEDADGPGAEEAH